jgi:hypothetical protein
MLGNSIFQSRLLLTQSLNLVVCLRYRAKYPLPGTIYVYVELYRYVLRSRSRCHQEQAKSVGASPVPTVPGTYVVEAAPGNPPGLLCDCFACSDYF